MRMTFMGISKAEDHLWRWYWKSPPHAFPAYISRLPFPFGLRGNYFGIRSSHPGPRRYRPISRPIFLLVRFHSFIHSFNIIQFINLEPKIPAITWISRFAILPIHYISGNSFTKTKQYARSTRATGHFCFASITESARNREGREKALR
jgi:hypothetical protein